MKIIITIVVLLLPIIGDCKFHALYRREGVNGEPLQEIEKKK
jgi:hypothetical protein